MILKSYESTRVRGEKKSWTYTEARKIETRKDEPIIIEQIENYECLLSLGDFFQWITCRRSWHLLPWAAHVLLSGLRAIEEDLAGSKIGMGSDAAPYQ